MAGVDQRLDELQRRLASGDIEWLRERFANGELEWLRHHLPEQDFSELGRRLRAGDLSWVKERTGRLASLAEAPGPVHDPGSAFYGPQRRSRLAWLWLLPLLAIGALTWWLLSRDDDSDSSTSASTTAIGAGATTTTAVATTTAVTTTAPPPLPATLAVIAASDPDLSTVAQLALAGGLTDVFIGPGPNTVFAPSNAAFAKADPAVLASLQSDPALLAKVVAYHVVPGRLTSAELKAGNYKTMEGSELSVSIDSGGVKINDALVLREDLIAGNGVLHVIDTILIPPPTPAPPVAAGPWNVFFASGSAQIDATGAETIAQAAAAIKTLPAGSTVQVVGNADTSGDAAANQALSTRRADAVKAALEQAVGSGYNLVVSALGETQPAADPAQSRRVSITIS